MTTTIRRNPFKRLLAMDTSTASMTVAIMDGDQLLGEVNEKALRSHSSKLVPAIQQLVDSLGMNMNDIDGVAAGRGPGSYTGVRISVTVAKTFAWTKRIPLIGVSSLSALAFGAMEQHDGREQWIVPLIDGRRGQVYTALYGIGNQGGSNAQVHLTNQQDSTMARQWICHHEDHIQPMETWIQQLTQKMEEMEDNTRPAQITFVGEVDAFLEQIKRMSEEVPGRVIAQSGDIQAYHVGQLAQQRWLHGEQDDAHSFVPNYAQLAEAEMKRLRKNCQI